MKKYDAARKFAEYTFISPDDFLYKMEGTDQKTTYEIKHKLSGVTIAFMCDNSSSYGSGYTLMEGLELSFKHVAEETLDQLKRHIDTLLKQKQLTHEVEVDNLVLQELLKHYHQTNE